MKSFKLLVLLVLASLMSLTALAQDRVRVSADFLDTKVPLINKSLGMEDEAIKGFGFDGDLKVLGYEKFRVSVDYNFQKMYHQEIYPNYFDGMKMVDLYRNVQTHFGGVQLGYTLAGAVEPFGGFFIGTRKVHEDANRQTVRKWRFGVNVPFHKESPFFVRGYIELEKPYGTLNSGFVDPASRHIGLGAGFRF